MKIETWDKNEILRTISSKIAKEHAARIFLKKDSRRRLKCDINWGFKTPPKLLSK